MNLAGRTSPSNSHDRDMLQADGRSSGKQARHRIDPDLEIAENAWSDEAVRDLLDEWLVPVIVDSIIGDVLNSGGNKVR